MKEKLDKYKVVSWSNQDGETVYAIERSGIYGFNRSSIKDQPPFSSKEEAQRYANEMNERAKENG